jgi:AcrR family transcriptional regulator
MVYVEASVRRGQIVSAARAVLMRDGVGRTTLRSVAAEAGIPLGTLHYVFPSKESLLQAVIEDVVEEIAAVIKTTAELDGGLAHAIRQGISSFWAQLVVDHTNLQLVQYELVTFALRTPGLEQLARRQYQRYSRIVAQWCQEAAHHSGETCAVPFDRLARIIVAGVDGLVLQHVCEPDRERSAEDLEAFIEMVLGLAAPVHERGRSGRRAAG